MFLDRLIPVVGALGGGLLCAFAIQIDLDTFADVYAFDFRAVSERSSAFRGTCVWQPPKDEVNAHLGGYWLHDDRSTCAGHVDRYRQTAAFSVHGMRWMLRNRTDRVPALNLPHLQTAYQVSKYAVIGRPMQIRYDDVSLALETVEFPSVSCAEIYEGVPAAASTWDDPTLPEPVCDDTTVITASNQDTSAIANEDSYLRYLCEKQFSFGRSKSSSHALRLPDFRGAFKPDINLFEGLMHFNDTSPWYMYSDVYVGLRYGSFMFYLIPHTALTVLLGVDAVLVVFWETTMKMRYRDIVAAAATTVGAAIGLMDQIATSDMFRSSRNALCALLWIIAAGLYGALSVTAFGVEGRKFPRPDCTATGWRSDDPNVTNTYMSLAFSLAGIVAHPISRSLNRLVRAGSIKRATVQVEAKTGGQAPPVAVQSRPKEGSDRTYMVLGGVTLGFIVLLADSVLLQIVFSSQWAKSITMPGSTTWNALKLENQVYNLGSSIVIIAASTGAVAALVLGRWLFGGLTCIFTVMFALWVGAAGAILVPLFTTDANKYIFDNLRIAAEGGEFDLAAGSDMCEGVDGAMHTYCKDARPFVVVGGALICVLAVVITSLYWCCRLTSNRACFNLTNKKKLMLNLTPRARKALATYAHETRQNAVYAQGTASSAEDSDTMPLLAVPPLSACNLSKTASRV